jgi:hypothetical protein
MWTLYEPVHAVTYFSAEARAAYEAAGVRGFWRGYFAGRVAPLGRVGPAPVTALFFGFAPRHVARALPALWDLIAPEAALETRTAGAVAALRRLLPADAPVERAGDLLARVVAAADCSGRALAAANAALPTPDEPLARLWHCATVLREHRGDGHVAALVSAGLDAPTAMVWRSAIDVVRAQMQAARGWTDDEWAAAGEELRARGWLDADGAITEAGRAAHDDIERRTDAAAAGPWRALDEDDLAELTSVLEPIATAAAAALPYPNPIALPRPVLTTGVASQSVA